jgi:hypothetical protein
MEAPRLHEAATHGAQNKWKHIGDDHQILPTIVFKYEFKDEHLLEEVAPQAVVIKSFHHVAVDTCE